MYSDLKYGREEGANHVRIIRRAFQASTKEVKVAI
jgi:hypothetical protein